MSMSRSGRQTPLPRTHVPAQIQGLPGATALPLHYPHSGAVAQPQHIPGQHYYASTPQPNSSDLLARRILDAIAPLIHSHQTDTTLRLESFQKNIRGVLEPLEHNMRNLAQSQDSIQKTILESNTALQQTLVAHTKTMKNILARVRTLECTIGGKRREGDETNSISDRLDAVNWSMGELLERAMDPYAAAETSQKHDIAIATSPMGQVHDLPAPESRPSGSPIVPLTMREQSTSPSQIVRHEMGVSPIKPVHTAHHEIAQGASPLRLPLDSPPENHSKDAEAPPQSSHSESSYRLTSADWSKDPPYLSGPHVGFFQPDLSSYNSLMNLAKPQSGLLTQSADSPSANNPVVSSSPGRSLLSPIRKMVPLPTPPKDDSLSNTDGIVINPPDSRRSASVKNYSEPKDQEDRNASATSPRTMRSPDKVVVTANNISGSPSPSVIDDEDSVLQMITHMAGPGSSTLGSPALNDAALDSGEKLDAFSRMEDDGSIPANILGLSTSPIASTSASAPISSLFSSPPPLDDELSDLTSISSSEGGTRKGAEIDSQRSRSEFDDIERPRKRTRLNGTSEHVARPLNQLRQKRGRKSKATASAGTGAAVVKQKPSTSVSAKTKQKVGRKRKSAVGIIWPEKVSNDEGISGTFIQCDICHLWYHCTCVGYSVDDPIVEAMAEFRCPACVKGKALLAPAASQDGKCARPDCTVSDDRDDIFFVERIIGRRTKVEGGVGKKYIWLVKWLNYDVYRATWEGEDSLGGNYKLIEEFAENLKDEGIEDDLSSTLLLKEASDGGWNPDEPDVIPFDLS